MEKYPLHLKNPELQTSPEVQRAVKRQEIRTGEYVPNNPTERLEAYMDRLENVFLNPDEQTRERNVDMFRDKIYDALIIKKENFPDSYFELQKRVAREQGYGDIQISEEMRERMMDTAIQDQKHSIDAWLDYLTSDDAVYPAWFKYYAWNQITKLSQFNKERGEFKKRTDSTVAPYPDIYQEPLAQISDKYTALPKIRQEIKNLRRRLKEPEPNDSPEDLKNQLALLEERRQELEEDFNKRFPVLYAELISKSLAASMENREEVRGQWVKYEQGDQDEAERLFQSLDGKGTGWCTAGQSTAKTQIESGDFYVYYTNDKSNQPIQPRLAIRMNGKERIDEVRGILPKQNIEPLMQETLDAKLKEFGSEADVYAKKSSDMKLLTVLERKKEKDEPFTKNDLTFLYEIDSTIECFGYERDPRIEELRKDRNTEEDMLVIFDCTKDQIARVPREINENTKAYIGQLEPGIFQKLPETLEHIYTSFPDKKIRLENIEIGGKTADQLIAEMTAKNINISDYAKSMLKSHEFTPTKNPEEITLISLTVADLGFKNNATTDQLYQRAEDLGLELCPADTGPHYRLKYQNQPLNEWVRVAMKQISGSRGRPDVFELGRLGGGLWLSSRWAIPGNEWIPHNVFVFRLRKSKT